MDKVKKLKEGIVVESKEGTIAFQFDEMITIHYLYNDEPNTITLSPSWFVRFILTSLDNYKTKSIKFKGDDNK